MNESPINPKDNIQIEKILLFLFDNVPHKRISPKKKIAALPERQKNNNGINQHRVIRLFRVSCIFIKEK